MAPFFTGKGDAGDTGFLGEGRISKASQKIEAVGSVDEASAVLGLARSLSDSETTQTIILHIQKQLYWLMAELSASEATAELFDRLSKEDVAWLEEQIIQLENALTMPKDFIVPGETPASGALSLARAIVRRAERRVVALYETGDLQKQGLIVYLNRLSSLIFILEVYESSRSGGGVRLVKEE